MRRPIAARPLPCALAVLGVLAASLALSRSAAAQRPLGRITVRAPTGGPADHVAEGADWFTLVLGSPRLMNTATDIRWVEHLLTTPVVDGSWRASFDRQGAAFLLFPGLPGAAQLDDQGAARPIHADAFRRIAFRMYTPEPTRFMWWGFPGGLGGPASAVAEGWSGPGWRTYLLPMDGDWRGVMRGLRIEFPDGARDVRLDWVRLLTADEAKPVNIAWTGPGWGTVDIYADDNGDPADGFAATVATGLADNGHYAWSPTLLPPGDYHVYLRHQADAPGAGAYSPGTFTVEPIPLLRFERPSAMTGDEYATTELGRPWDMNGPDVLFAGGSPPWSWRGLTAFPAFQEGLLRARTRDADPYFFLDVDPNRPIDAGRYHYLSWRWRVSGDFLHSSNALSDIHGWVTRFQYYDRYPYQTARINTLNDILVWPGWNTYTLDLARGHLDDAAPGPGPGWVGPKTGLRFDPLEGRQAYDFEVDWIRLTADPVARAGSGFALSWSLRAGQRPFVIRLRYDSDRDWSNGYAGVIGELAVGTGQSPAPRPTLPVRLFLPWVRPDRMSLAYTWRVPEALRGTYHIAAEVDDGWSVTRWYAEVPVVVVP